ncbi:hypothetical protein GNF42_15465, partial [Clostridium perfringens]|uniref:fibronectin type III domain-containing protein n=1 Tax=Clostridium perfringens TaxID=1502 RepID=UPI002AC41BC9
AYINAIKVMNDDNVKDENIKIATNTLNQAALGLKENPLTTPPDVGDARVEAIGIESSTLMLRWTLVPDAASYNVYRVDNLTGEEILLTNTTSLYYRVSDLAPGVTYTFKVKAINKNGIEGALPSINVTTKFILDKERPSDVKN